MKEVVVLVLLLVLCARHEDREVAETGVKMVLVWRLLCNIEYVLLYSNRSEVKEGGHHALSPRI